MIKKILIILTLSFTFNSFSQVPYQPSKENLQSRKWFQEAKFGLFIHWGIYSLLGDGEWVMNNQNISISNYEKLAGFFNPIAFDAEAWVMMAKNAGMKYITITTRHHDGFSMFKSNATDYNIVDRTPYKKDILKQLADACRKHDIKLFFYYSLLDWRRADYFPVGRTGIDIKGREENGQWNDYIAFMKSQLTELLTNYGEIGGIWFDGHWDQVDWDGKKFGKLNADWKYDEIYGLIHKLQPQALIGNNHHLAPIAGEDFQMFERDLPGINTTGWGTTADNLGVLPFEMCQTINGAWGFNLQDDDHKSAGELIRLLVSASGFNSNLLLNVGPMPNGEIQPEHIASLREVGQWMKTNGETIYGTTSGPVGPKDWGVSTKKGNKIYLHILELGDQELILQDLKLRARKVTLFKDGSPVKYKQQKNGFRINIPENKKDPVDTIVVIDLK